MRVLVSWFGDLDLKLMQSDKTGAIATIALKAEQPFDEVLILSNRLEEHWDSYKKWLEKRLFMISRPNNVQFRTASIKSAIDYDSVYKFIKKLYLKELSDKYSSIGINLTSGTPAMSVVSVLVGKAIPQCEFYQSTPKNECIREEIPVDFAHSYKEVTESNFEAVIQETPRIESAFNDIIANSPAMSECVNKAQRLALTDFPALILGETGTGKERMAQAIHRASSRKEKPLITVNCGAFAENLLDSKLFGHKKGAFTGANADAKGIFEEANGGTVFLDEVGELSKEAQVKLLRVLQQKEITPLGSNETKKVDIRIIAATHRDLAQMVSGGEFREDLYFRLAVGILNIPALRDRSEDFEVLFKALLKEVNQAAGLHNSFSSKNISKDVINFAKNEAWSGNIRELANTISRAVLWSDDKNISLEEFKKAMHLPLKSANNEQPKLINGKTLDLQQMLDSISKKYILEALKMTGSNKSRASKMLGFNSHQTLNNWMARLEME